MPFWFSSLSEMLFQINFLVSLVPTPHFRQTFRTPRNPLSQLQHSFEASDNVETVTKILEFLLSLLKNCKQYIDISCHGINKLVSYFSVMTHLLLSKQEKLLLSPYFTDLWQLFHPKLSEPSILYLLWTQDILTILVPMFHRWIPLHKLWLNSIYFMSRLHVSAAIQTPLRLGHCSYRDSGDRECPQPSSATVNLCNTCCSWRSLPTS